MFIIFFDHYQQATNSPDGGRCIQNLSARRNAPSDFFVSFRLPRSFPAAIASIIPFLALALPHLLPPSLFLSFSLFLSLSLSFSPQFSFAILLLFPRSVCSLAFKLSLAFDNAQRLFRVEGPEMFQQDKKMETSEQDRSTRESFER